MLHFVTVTITVYLQIYSSNTRHTQEPKTLKIVATEMKLFETEHTKPRITEQKSHYGTRIKNMLYCYNSFCLPLRSLESPIFFLLSLATEPVGELSSSSSWLSRKTCWDSLATLLDLFLSPELKAAEDSIVERLIAESASEDGTVTERLLHNSKLCWPWS